MLLDMYMISIALELNLTQMVCKTKPDHVLTAQRADLTPFARSSPKSTHRWPAPGRSSTARRRSVLPWSTNEPNEVGDHATYNRWERVHQYRRRVAQALWQGEPCEEEQIRIRCSARRCKGRPPRWALTNTSILNHFWLVIFLHGNRGALDLVSRLESHSLHEERGLWISKLIDCHGFLCLWSISMDPVAISFAVLKLTCSVW